MLFTYKTNPETPTDLYARLNNCEKKEHNSSMTCHIACQTLPIYINEHDVISSRDHVKCPVHWFWDFDPACDPAWSCAYCEKAPEKDSFSQVFSQVFFTGFFTGCDYVKSVLFTGFEILDPVKKHVKKLQSKILFHWFFHRFFHRFYFTGFLTGFFTGFDPVKSALFTGFQNFTSCEKPVKNLWKNTWKLVFHRFFHRKIHRFFMGFSQVLIQ